MEGRHWIVCISSIHHPWWRKEWHGHLVVIFIRNMKRLHYIYDYKMTMEVMWKILHKWHGKLWPSIMWPNAIFLWVHDVSSCDIKQYFQNVINNYKMTNCHFPELQMTGVHCELTWNMYSTFHCGLKWL